MERLLKGATFYAPVIFLILIFICLVARVVIGWRSPRHRRVLPVPVAEDVALYDGRGATRIDEPPKPRRPGWRRRPCARRRRYGGT